MSVYDQKQQASLQPVPHQRTLRKARENVKSMVASGLSARKIRDYLTRWAMWWQNTSGTWEYQVLLEQFVEVCWHETASHYALGLSQLYFNKLRTDSLPTGVAA